MSEETVTVQKQVRIATRAYRVPEYNSFSKELDIKRPDMKETERSGGNLKHKEWEALKHKEWEALKQRVEQMEF